MNILILSAGTRNKIVQYFKKAVGDDGKVIATDMSKLAPSYLRSRSILYSAENYRFQLY